MNGRQFLKRISSPFLKLVSKYYLNRNRNFKYKNIEIDVLSGVFHPGLFLSTKQLLLLADSLSLRNKQVLELGAGSGAISVYCSTLGANVTATDINGLAIKNVNQNAEKNGVTINSIESNLFNDIPVQVFDFIFINPPYYPKAPKTDAEYAWFCGPSFEYFEQLFLQLEKYVNESANVFIILSEDCALDKIEAIANKNSFDLVLHKKVKVMLEWNFIFNAKQLKA